MTTSLSLSQRCMSMLGFLFWSVVNLSFLAVGILFLFAPGRIMPMISATSNLPTEEDTNPKGFAFFRAIGALYLFVAGGTNHMVTETLYDASPHFKRLVYTATSLYYIAANIIFLWLVTPLRDNDLFTGDHAFEWSVTVTVLSSLFLGAMGLGLIGTCYGAFSGFTVAFTTFMTPRHLPPLLKDHPKHAPN